MLKQPNPEMLCTYPHTRKWTWDRFVTMVAMCYAFELFGLASSVEGVVEM